MSKHHPDLIMCRRQTGIDFVRNAMANAPYVILTYDQKLLFASVMSAILARMVVVALSVALQGFPMLTTARSVHA
ncbi:hypothetical protein FS837_005831 [Tulasnella sp. UAMH 9824]|nr:hypothetical protein FS837_005831 [Tulasnella sp. UAMH 9824]